MSVSLVRKALEISSADSGLTATTTKKNKLSKKEKLAERKKKKSTPDAIQKRNLKYLKSLDALKPKKVQDKIQPLVQSKKKKNKKTPEDDPNKTVFTDEDFAKFEQEYFVS